MVLSWSTMSFYEHNCIVYLDTKHYVSETVHMRAIW